MEDLRNKLLAWRKAHPDATMDEIVARVTPRRRELMGQLIEELATLESEEAEAEVPCPICGQMAEFRACQTRQVIHFEGDSTLGRRYYYCPRCERGFFPPGPASCVDQTRVGA
jgi:hypothetical protein